MFKTKKSFWTLGLPASTFPMLRLQACTATAGLCDTETETHSLCLASKQSTNWATCYTHCFLMEGKWKLLNPQWERAQLYRTGAFQRYTNILTIFHLANAGELGCVCLDPPQCELSVCTVPWWASRRLWCVWACMEVCGRGSEGDSEWEVSSEREVGHGFSVALALFCCSALHRGH